MSPAWSMGLDLYYTDPAQHIISAGWDLVDISADFLSDLSDVNYL